MKPWQIALGLVSILGVVVALTAYTWFQMADTTMSANGIIALVVGVGLSLALGIGLMALVFYSSRSGHDDSVRDDKSGRD
jgi:predicted phage tail protein